MPSTHICTKTLLLATYKSNFVKEVLKVLNLWSWEDFTCMKEVSTKDDDTY